MFRTPVKSTKDADEDPIMLTLTASTVTESADATTSSVRRSIGEGEPEKRDTRTDTTYLQSPEKTKRQVALQKQKQTVTRRHSVESPATPTTAASGKSSDRLAEAKACLVKAKTYLSYTKTLRTDIKSVIIESLDTLYRLAKEGHASNVKKVTAQVKERITTQDNTTGSDKGSQQLEDMIHRHTQKMEENNESMLRLKEALERKTYADRDETEQNISIEKILSEITQLRLSLENTEKGVTTLQSLAERKTYANVTATTPTTPRFPENTALHSVVITAKNDMETGDEILNRIRKAVNASEGGVQVDRVRKAKDRKVILGCRTEEERRKIKERLKGANELCVEDVKNKDPLVILKDVLLHNTDEDVLRSLRAQNKEIFQNIDKENDRISIVYKKRARNPHTCSIVLRVSPTLWQRMVQTEAVHVDLQRVRVADQSPLVQCSLCLGYGHGRRICNEALPKCSHCGGPHLKQDCAEWLAGSTPTCCNCTRSKQERTDCTILHQAHRLVSSGTNS